MASSETFVTAPPTGSAAEDKSMEGQQILDKARGQLILYIVLSTLAIFAVGVAVYVAYSRDDDVCWPAVLLILPIALQFIGVWVLYLKIVRGKDGKVWTFYWFYLWGMIWCWWTCAFLLLFYTFYPSDPNGLMAWLLRWLPLIFICWLLGHVLLMTHVIMKPRSYTADLEPRPASDEGKHRLRPSETRMKDWLRSFETRMRDSVARVPHFGVLFFFSVFMAVAYVFGFAFAYHDKDRLATTKRPALFRAKNLAVEAPGNPQAGTVMQPGQDSGRELTDCIWPEYRFYYDSDENFPVTIKPAEDDRGTRYHVHLDEYPNSEKPEHWRVAKNTDSLSEVATQIGARLDEGKQVRVEIFGQTDPKEFKGGAQYGSNFELASARSQQLRSKIQEALSDTRPGNEQSRVTILCLAEPGAVAKPKYGKGADSKQGIDQGDSLKNREAEISTRLEKSYRDLEQGFETYKRKYEVSDADKTRSKAVEDTDKALQTFIDDTLNAKREMKWNEERLNLKGQEAAHAESLIVSEWSYVRRLIDDAEEKAFADPTDRESNGAKRRCIVRVTAIAPMTSPPDPPAPPLKLMDYLYFSIYTITTTGNGDIIPTTPYSKFLVSFANITEVIFLVVFFNALISLRSNTTSIFSTTQTFPAAGGTGTIYVTVPDGAKWRVPQDEDDAQQERREMLEIEKVTPPEHHGSRQIAYVVKENTLITKREAVLPLLDRTFTVVQEAAPIKYEIEVNLMAPLPPEECYYTLKIKSPDGCPWFVEPKFLNGKAGWLEIEAPQYGTGTATVRFKVHKTDTREPRKAFFVINGGKNQQEVVQSGGVLRVTLREELVNNAVVERVNGAGGPISLIVDAPGDLSWTASSDRDWITPRRARTGNGRQSPTFTVTENRTDERRDGTITIDEDGGAARNSIQVHIKQEAIKRGRNSGQ